jgi:transposase-like protein
MPLLAADPVSVLPDQREALEQLLRTHSTPQQLALRARVIVHAVEGLGVRESARELGVWPKTVRYWRRRWRQADDKHPSKSPMAVIVFEVDNDWLRGVGPPNGHFHRVEIGTG